MARRLGWKVRRRAPQGCGSLGEKYTFVLPGIYPSADVSCLFLIYPVGTLIKRAGSRAGRESSFAIGLCDESSVYEEMIKMSHLRLSVTMLLVSLVLVFGLLLSGCSSSSAVSSAPDEAASADRDAAEDSDFIADLAALLQADDVEALASMVAESGLIIAPYALGAPDQGLTGSELSSTLEAMLEDARPEVVAFDRNNPGKLSVVVSGLNEVEIVPAVGDPVMVANPVEFQFRQEEGDKWQLAIIAVDTTGLLAERMGQEPYERWQGLQ